MILIMTKEELFVPGNLIFVSRHNNVVGSLYFRGVDKGGRVYRGRIRLCHDCGPTIENDEVLDWKVSNIYDDKKEKESFNVYLGMQVEEGGTYLSEMFILQDKNNTKKKHTSRGCLSLDKGGITPDIISNLLALIEPFTKWQSDNFHFVEAINNAIKNYLNNTNVVLLHQ